MPGQWAGSDRRDRLPHNWAELRAAVKARAGGQCEHIKASTGRRCPNPGTDCDHIQRGDDHTVSNLRWLCRWHHSRKSSAEGAEAMRTQRAKLTRPQPKHPGMR